MVKKENQMKLSILIPTLPERQHYLNELFACINMQNNGELEVLTDARTRQTTAGEKRNALIAKAKGDYVWQVDDDDLIMTGAIAAIFKALETNPDCLAINGIMTTNGKNLERWKIAIGNPYEKVNGVYLRYPNHITPMKREIASQVKFQHITIQEDYKWATEIKNRGLLKTQVVVDIPVYHYRFRTKK